MEYPAPIKTEPDIVQDIRRQAFDDERGSSEALSVCMAPDHAHDEHAGSQSCGHTNWAVLNGNTFAGGNTEPTGRLQIHVRRRLTVRHVIACHEDFNKIRYPRNIQASDHSTTVARRSNGDTKTTSSCFGHKLHSVLITLEVLFEQFHHLGLKGYLQLCGVCDSCSRREVIKDLVCGPSQEITDLRLRGRVSMRFQSLPPCLPSQSFGIYEDTIAVKNNRSLIHVSRQGLHPYA